MNLGFSGRIAAQFQSSPLTPLLGLTALLLGLFAVLITPREEEPQIDVTFANVFVSFPGAAVEDVENLVSYPLEQVLSEVEGVKHVYSVSQPGQAVLTVEFQVGIPRQPAIVRLYNAIYSNQDLIPRHLGVGPPLVRPMGIDDVPVLALTLWSSDTQRSPSELAEVAHTLETEIKHLNGTRDVYTLGAPERVVLVELDAERLASYGLSVLELSQALQGANVAAQAGALIEQNRYTPVTAGTLLARAEDVAGLVIGQRNGKPLYLDEVARIRQGGDLATRYVWHAAPRQPMTPAVTLAIAKKPGVNAADLTQAVRARVAELRGQLIPSDIQLTVSRDYGLTADAKAQQLIHKLIFATSAVVLLVLFSLGWREALVVGSAVVITLALTLFASWAWGFTINRVSLFALIFSIGILVDDAIVVVENIHRHLSLGGRSLAEAIAPAVDEVGGPTILATFTVIAALLPMAFVSGLMGPYMSPIPINASTGMLLSLAVALMVTPWLALKLLRHSHSAEAPAGEPGLLGLFQRLLTPFMGRGKARLHRYVLGFSLVLLVLGALGLTVTQTVVLKMLPFDNKSELQILVDLPEGSTLEQTNRVLTDLAQTLNQVPEVEHYQGYAGTSAPVNFNGLVRQYYLRQAPNQGDLQVNLVDKHARTRQSHAIAQALRPALTQIAERYGAALKVVEVPPGPPVLAPLVAEIYGPDYAGQRQFAQRLQQLFQHTADIVDVDSTVETPTAERQVWVVDRAKAARLGLSQAAIVQSISTALAGFDASYIQDGASKYAVPIRLRLPAGEQAAQLLNLRVRSTNGALIPLGEVVNSLTTPWEGAIYHKDLQPYTMVSADMAGRLDSPLYGMAELVAHLNQGVLGDIQQRFIDAPQRGYGYAIKWDGEWQITYETFRDMGLAYSVGLILIYLLVVAQFRSYLVPLIIMAPIPLTLIGIMPGHALWGVPFTATSMIGMIALAGIIVRNSILLVDFINHELAHGQSLEMAVIRAGAVRAKPITLTAVAAMTGALFILDDPIFNGLAVALISGTLVATLLTLVVIPLLYYALLARRQSLAK